MPAVDATRTRRLIEFVLLPDGAEMHCTACGAGRGLHVSAESSVEVEILLFQEEHFECDPQLSLDVPTPR